MLRLRKGKKEVARFNSMFEFADMEALIIEHFGQRNLEAVQTFARRSAFGMAIKGSKARLGNGYIVENC